MHLGELHPSLWVVVGSVFVIFAGLLSRVLFRRFSIPPIVTLLLVGVLIGPSGFRIIHVDLLEPATRALLSLAVAIVIFETTLRINIRNVSKARLLGLTLLGSVMTMMTVPVVATRLGIHIRVALMIAAICIVTGPTVISSLLARLRLSPALTALLETESLLLDALGVIIAATAFAAVTTRATGPQTVLFASLHIGAGVAIGLGIGYIAGHLARSMTHYSSDITKLYLLFICVATYAVAETVERGSGLAALVACGFVLDVRTLPQERMVLSFQADLSMLALSVVFVLLASQIKIAALLPLALPAAVISIVIVCARAASVAVAMAGSKDYSVGERAVISALFPRGIVAIALSAYYATQLSAANIPGGGNLDEYVFLVVVITIPLSAAGSILVTNLFGLQMPLVAIVGASEATIAEAREFLKRGYRVLFLDRRMSAVHLARANDMDAEFADPPKTLASIAGARNARYVVLDKGFESEAQHFGDRLVEPNEIIGLKGNGGR